MDQEHEDYSDDGRRPPPLWVVALVIAGVVGAAALLAMVAFVAWLLYDFSRWN